MPTPINRERHDSLRTKVKRFLLDSGCSFPITGTYLPMDMGTNLYGGPMEALLATRIPRSLSPCGMLGIRCITQRGKGSAGAKLPGVVCAIREKWSVPGVILAEGEAGLDLDGYVAWARGEKVDGRQLLYVGDLAGFRVLFNQHLPKEADIHVNPTW